ncbi:hypothetical protein AOLI_G00180190 [Acnodon oligacanthus]
MSCSLKRKLQSEDEDEKEPKVVAILADPQPERQALQSCRDSSVAPRPHHQYAEAHLAGAQPAGSTDPDSNTERRYRGSIFLPELSLDDFLFSDINNFLCELNPGGPNPGLAQGSSSSKVVPMVTDDLGRLTNQPFNTDLNELDKIMEVLAGS